jgi:hypothetical protein
VPVRALRMGCRNGRGGVCWELHLGVLLPRRLSVANADELLGRPRIVLSPGMNVPSAVTLKYVWARRVRRVVLWCSSSSDVVFLPDVCVWGGEVARTGSYRFVAALISIGGEGGAVHY